MANPNIQNEPKSQPNKIQKPEIKPEPSKRNASTAPKADDLRHTEEDLSDDMENEGDPNVRSDRDSKENSF